MTLKPRESSGTRLQPHININTQVFQYPSSPLKKLWQKFPLRPYFVQLSETSLMFRARISFAFVFAFCLFVFMHSLIGSGGDFENGSLHLSEEADILNNVFPSEGDEQATAILLSWSSLENLKVVVKHLCPYSMFKEIMVWNNNADLHLMDQVFETAVCNKLRLYNLPGNMHSVVRYMACAMATTEYCYFQDDDWIVSPLRSVYANFLRSTHIAQIITDAKVYAFSSWKWCFFDDAVSLHACFSWVGTGAFVSRQSVIEFLKMASLTEMDATEFAYSDMYFTTYMNQVPYLLETELIDLSQKNMSSKSGTHNKVYMHKALTRLYDNLNIMTDTFETKELAPSLYQRDVRAPCANDRCLFLTNKHSFPDIRLFIYKPYINISESEQFHESYHNTDYFFQHPYSHAVDGQEDTAWKSHEIIRSKDYIGLDLLLPMPVPLTFTLLVDHHPEFFKYTIISISVNGVQWIDLTDIQVSCLQLSQTPIDSKIHLQSCNFHVQETGFRFIHLTTTRSWKFCFGVYEFGFHAQKD